MIRILVLFVSISFLVGCGPVKKGDYFSKEVWVDGKGISEPYYKKGVELEGGDIFYEVLPKKQRAFEHTALTVKKNSRGRYKVTGVYSKEDLRLLSEQFDINKEKQAKEKERLRVARLKKIQNGRSYLGLFFGMTPKDVQHVKNEKIVCEPLDLRGDPDEGYSDRRGEYYNDRAAMRSWMRDPDNRVWNLGPLWSRNFGTNCTRVGYEGSVNLFFDYKESPSLSGVRFKQSELGDLSTFVRKLKKKYKFIAGPGLTGSMKRLLIGNSVTYWFENNTSPKKPKYISLHTEDGIDIVWGELVRVPNQDVMITYYSEERGLALVSKILAEKEYERVKKEQARKSKLSEDDDL